MERQNRWPRHITEEKGNKEDGQSCHDGHSITTEGQRTSFARKEYPESGAYSGSEGGISGPSGLRIWG